MDFKEMRVNSIYLLFACLSLSLAGWSGSVTAIEPPITVDSVQLGFPVSSIDGEGAIEGSLFIGDFGEMTISMDSNNPTGYMSAWMQVNVSGASVSYYEWEIVGWKGQHPYGKLSSYDEVIVIDPVLESYRVKTVGNTIRYDSTTNSLLLSNHVELIKVTAWTTDGSFTTAHFQITPSPTQTSQLADMFFSAGFAPSSPNSTLIAQVTDLHVDPGENYFPTPTLDDRLVDAINQLEFLPDELVVTGDIANSRTPTVGMPRFDYHVRLTREEMEAAVIEMQRFDSRMRQWIIPGNHDTDAHEIQPELFTEITGYPAFQRADISGAPVFFLNGKHSGDFDAAQIAWLEVEFATVADDQDIVVFVHQPSLNQISVERGIKTELVRMLAGRSGRVFVFAGHHHLFYEKKYIENGTQFILTVTATANPLVFSVGGHNPGYSLIGLQDGRVVLRISKDVKESNYTLLPPVLPGEGKAFIWPYEDVEFPVLTRDEGAYSRDDYSFQVVARDTGTWLVGVDNISWGLPLSSYDETVNEVLVLGAKAYFVEFSPDRAAGSWQSVGTFYSTKNVFRIPIPEQFIGTDVFVKVTSVQQGNVFAGWGLSVDSFPDHDGDGVDNNTDTDDDNDGVLDINDDFPFDSAESKDSDGDLIGDNADTDDDNDGVLDINDDFPFDPAESKDTDGDLIGDNADTDDDNDGLLDTIEDVNGNGVWDAGETNSLNADTDADGISDGVEDANQNGIVDEGETNPLNEDTDGDGLLDGVDPDPLVASEAPSGGDLAPLGAPDGVVNAADVLIAQRIVLGLITPTQLDLHNGDVYPPGAPDGVINVQDLLLIQQMVLQ